MARLLRDNDYKRLIQDDNLLQVIESNQSIKLDVEQSAQAEMTSYLAQRYIVGSVFTNTSLYSNTIAYKGKNLIEYTAPAHNVATTYSVGTRISYLDNIYECAVISTGFLPTNITYWTLICADKALFYVKLPYSEYDNATSYTAGTQIWYNDYVYTNTFACVGVIPTNTAFWSVSALPYTVTAGTLPTDTTKWSAGDNRNQQIVMYLIDITLYHLHSRINPRNIPDLRKERYDGNNPQQNGGAIAWLKRCASGDVTADLPNILPQQGMSIRYNIIDSFTNNTY
jgi:hypothetical protein